MGLRDAVRLSEEPFCLRGVCKLLVLRANMLISMVKRKGGMMRRHKMKKGGVSKVITHRSHVNLKFYENRL